MLDELGYFMRGAEKKKEEEEKFDKKYADGLKSNNEKNLFASYEYTKAIQKTKNSLHEGDSVSFTRDGRRFIGRIVSKEINEVMGQTRNVGLSEHTLLVEVIANPRTGAKYRCSLRYAEVTKI